MNFLAIDTSTQTLSMGLLHGERRWLVAEEGGAKASSRAIPVASSLLQEAGLEWRDLTALVWGCGPGTFTGLRTACALVQGWAYAHDLPVISIPTLAAVAQDASIHFRDQDLDGESKERVTQLEMSPGNIWAVMDARMQEVYITSYAWNGWWQTDGHAMSLLRVEELASLPGDCLVGHLPEEVKSGCLSSGNKRVIPSTPSASALLDLAPVWWKNGDICTARNVQPMYIRDKVALTTAERQKEAC